MGGRGTKLKLFDDQLAEGSLGVCMCVCVCAYVLCLWKKGMLVKGGRELPHESRMCVLAIEVDLVVVLTVVVWRLLGVRVTLPDAGAPRSTTIIAPGVVCRRANFPRAKRQRKVESNLRQHKPYSTSSECVGE